MNNKSLVVIPTYNEKENIQDILDAVMQLPAYFHVLVVDDNSPDGTANLVKLKMQTHPERIFIQERKGKLGLGTAYIHGFKWGLNNGFDYIFEMDADFSHNPKDLERLLTACLNQEAKVAIGSRYVTGVNVVNWPMGRVLMSYFASVYVRFITRMPFRDSTAGFMCWHRSVLEKVALDEVKFVGYAFQIEMKFRAWVKGFKITEVPIIFTDRTRGESKLSGGIIREAVLGVLTLKIRQLIGNIK